MTTSRPTRILTKPQLDSSGIRRELLLNTDIGWLTIGVAAKKCLIPYQTLYSRVAGNGWQGDDVFSPSRRKAHRGPWCETNTDSPPRQKPILERPLAIRDPPAKSCAEQNTEYRQALRKHLGLDREQREGD